MTPLTSGFGVLWQRYAAWLDAGTTRDVLVRLGGTAFAGYMLVGIVIATPWLVAVLAGWLIAAAWIAGTADEEGEESKDGPELLSSEEFTEIVRDAIGDGNGIHLSTLTERLADVEPDAEWDTATVRLLATEAGLTVTSSVREKGRGVSTGIRSRDLPPPPPPSGEGGDVGGSSAGQGATATATELAVEEVGQSGLIFRDPAEITRRYEVPRTR